MNIKLGFNRSLALAAVLSMLVVGQLGGGTVLAASSTDDGRINKQTWAYAGEAIAVYCLDKDGNVAGTLDGGLKILNEDSESILKVSKAEIDFGQAALTTGAGKLPSVEIGITDDGIFTLYMLYAVDSSGNVSPDNFQINAGPVRIGFWKDCGPTSDPVAPPPCVFTFQPNFVDAIPCCPVRDSISTDTLSGTFVNFALPELPVFAQASPCCGCCAPIPSSDRYSPDSSGEFAKFMPQSFGRVPIEKSGYGPLAVTC